jgi:hypothetical protein
MHFPKFITTVAVALISACSIAVPAFAAEAPSKPDLIITEPGSRTVAELRVKNEKIEVTVFCTVRRRAGTITAAKIEANVTEAKSLGADIEPKSPMNKEDAVVTGRYVYIVTGAPLTGGVGLAFILRDPCKRPGDPMLAASALRERTTPITGKVAVSTPPITEVPS